MECGWTSELARLYGLVKCSAVCVCVCVCVRGPHDLKSHWLYTESIQFSVLCINSRSGGKRMWPVTFFSPYVMLLLCMCVHHWKEMFGYLCCKMVFTVQSGFCLYYTHQNRIQGRTYLISVMCFSVFIKWKLGVEAKFPNSTSAFKFRSFSKLFQTLTSKSPRIKI